MKHWKWTITIGHTWHLKIPLALAISDTQKARLNLVAMETFQKYLTGRKERTYLTNVLDLKRCQPVVNACSINGQTRFKMEFNVKLEIVIKMRARIVRLRQINKFKQKKCSYYMHVFTSKK